MKIRRKYNLTKEIRQGKVLVIYGARRVGKTTLLKDFLDSTNLRYRYEQGENLSTQRIFSSQELSVLNSAVEGYELLAIDEAQFIPNIGVNLKMIVDANPHLYVVVTGSSSFDLSGNIGEPLTGRMILLNLYPFSIQELSQIYNRFDLNQKLEEFLLYGLYPEVILTRTTTEKARYLQLLTDAYLFKDILAFEGLRKADLLVKLVKLLAFQVGNLVSLNELSQKLQINVRTVERYIDLLEKTFVIYRLYPLSTNPRKEINRKFKVYFFDNGVRNAVIGQFMPLAERADVGQLWENFMMSELLKKRTYDRQFVFRYFWRNYAGAEVDLVEEMNGQFLAYEFKFTKKSVKLSRDFMTRYQPKQVFVVNKDNFLDFLL